MRKMTYTRYSQPNVRRVLAASAVGVAFLLLGPAPLALAAGTSFNNVQVFVTTSSDLKYSYSYAVYNSSGSLVASYNGPYPAAAFELPSGDYLFTVSANHDTYRCLACLVPQGGMPVVNGTSPPPGNGTGPVNYSPIAAGSGSTTPVFKYYNPAAEYGYAVAHIGSSTTINIATMNVTKLPTETVGVRVTFENGTAAVNASVSASVVGDYYWWGVDNRTVMWAQTDSQGFAKLVIPAAPVVISAWNWVKVNVPINTTSTVDIGGQEVNVTSYWDPTYVGLSGTTLLIPPSTSASITLSYQKPMYWAVPLGVKYAQSTGATVSSAPSGTPTSAVQPSSTDQYTPSAIPALSLEQASGSASPAGLTLELIAIAGVATLCAIGAAFVVNSRRKPKAPA
jgi:hypothetical protein